MAANVTDTDINKVIQDKTNLPQWPAMVHKFTPNADPEQPGTFAQKRVENEQERSTWLKAGWFKTPLEAESAATKGKPARTKNAPKDGDEAAAE